MNTVVILNRSFSLAQRINTVVILNRSFSLALLLSKAMNAIKLNFPRLLQLELMTPLN
jgi:hypothetical protein